MKIQMRVFSVCFLLLALPICVIAQTGTSRISGTVTDPRGAVIVGAQVTVKSEATGVTYTGKTTSAGAYVFPDIPVGEYSVIVEAQGFRKVVSTRNVLTVGSPLVVDVALEVGATTEVVEVQGGYDRVETSHAMLGDVVDAKAIRDLPLNGRNPLSLIMLEPGLIQRTTNGTGSGTHVNGSRDRSHNVTIDGIDANESSVPNPQSNVYRLNPDMVMEYRVVTHNATPEFGRNSGAQVAIATRPGTNEIHADVFEFFRNEALNSNEFFNNTKGVERPLLRAHQYGVDGGGPIKKDRTFFFGSWQGQNIYYTQPIANSFGIPLVFTEAARNGVFRYFVPDPKNPLVISGRTITANSPLLVNQQTGALLVPTCSGSITANCVASYNIFSADPKALGLDPKIGTFIKKYPTPNSFDVGDGLNTGGFVWNPPEKRTGPTFTVRVDHKFDENNSAFVRYIHGHFDSVDGDLLNARPKVFPSFPPLGEVSRAHRNLAINYRRVISPSIVNEFTAGLARFVFHFTFGESNPDFPNIEPFTFSNISSPVLNIPHTERALTTIQFIDNFSVIHGAHVIRTGFNIRLVRHNDQRGLAGGFNLAPDISFSSTVRAPTGFTFPVTFLPVSSSNPNGRAGIASGDLTNLRSAVNELLGIPARIQQGYIGNLNDDKFLGLGGLFVNGNRFKQYNYYAQDEWKIGPRLTLNYGLRIEYNPAPTEANNLVFVPDKPVDGSQGLVNFVRAKRWYSNDNTLGFAPRISLAWDPFGNGKTVVRTGYGVAFDPLSTFQVTSISGKVPGLVTQCRTTVGQSSSAGCPPVPDLRIGQGFPLLLPAPSKSPVSFLSLPAAPYLIAPDIGVFDPKLKVSTVHEWNLNIQRQLPFGIVAQAGYVGKRGLRLLRSYDINQMKINHDGLLESFLVAQSNQRKGCNPDGTGCPTGVTGQNPGILLTLFGASNLNASASVTDLQRNALANMIQRIDRTDITAKGFPANFFRPSPQFSQILYIDSGGNSYYHAFQLQLRRHFQKGLDMGLAYTLGKSIDDMSVDPVGATSGGRIGTTGTPTTSSSVPVDIFDWRLDRSRSDFDNRHVLVVHTLWDIPVGRDRRFLTNAPGFVNQIIGGWSLTGIYNYQSGEPFSIHSGAATASTSHISRADIIGPKPKTGFFSVPNVIGPVLFESSAFDPNTNCVDVGNGSKLCIPAPGKNGNQGRNVFDGPSFWNFDFGALKNFVITERVKLQFRLETFNTFNHVNFENPRNSTEGSTSITSTAFGRVCCTSASTPSTATIISIGEAPRVVQFALKLSF